MNIFYLGEIFSQLKMKGAGPTALERDGPNFVIMGQWPGPTINLKACLCEWDMPWHHSVWSLFNACAFNFQLRTDIIQHAAACLRRLIRLGIYVQTDLGIWVFAASACCFVNFVSLVGVVCRRNLTNNRYKPKHLCSILPQTVYASDIR